MAQAQGRLVGGRYHLVEQIGRGGMGVVWRAHDELLDREVAVKEVRFDSAMGDELSDLNRRTMREARAAGRLTHPNVVVVHDVIEEDDRPWIVMQLVPSRSLGQVIRQDGPLTPERTAEIGLQVLDALRAAHRQGVLHRDVKPENVLLAEDGRVVLTDFGIARIEADSTMTRTGLVGTPAFIPPERLRGSPAQRESDLWSLGATLYAAVEGRPPHDKGMAMATMHAVLNEEPVPPKHAGRLGPVLTRLLAKEPEDRPGYDEITRLLRQAAHPAAPAAPAGTATKSPAPEAGTTGGDASRAGARPYAAEAKRPQPVEDDRAAATRKAPSAKSPSRPAAATAGAVSASGAPAPDSAPSGQGKKASSKQASGKSPSGKGKPSQGDRKPLSGSGMDEGNAADPGEITSPLPALGADGLPVSEAEPGTSEPGTAAADEATDGKPQRGEAQEDRAQEDKPSGKAAPPKAETDDAEKPGKSDAASDRDVASASNGVADSSAATAEGDDGPEAKKSSPDSSPGSGKARRTAMPMPETGSQAPPPAAKAVPVHAGIAKEPAPALPDPAGAAVPTQPSTEWPASTRPVERRPMPLVKVALVLVPVLVVIAGVAGYLGLRDGERSSTQTLGPASETTASSPAEASPKSKKSPKAEVAPPVASPSAEDDQASPSPEPTPDDTANPTPAASEPADVPEGWHKYKHPSGFSLALPKGWHVDGQGNGEVRLRGNEHTYLEVHHTSSPESDALKVWRRDAPGMSRNFPGYKLIEIREVKGYWKTAADWEFTFGDSRYRSRVIDRGFVTDKNNGYALLYKTRDKDWKEKRKLFETIAATFKPAK
ncbi:protein kinase [Sphaerimonospora cavernae]|uniref:non-specific serine/threonine protein kinase n=1 Tax=Sphaerimonospora cavernae TaxID=1740611 RepID=A0ABV6TXF7_9ACTN